MQKLLWLSILVLIGQFILISCRTNTETHVLKLSKTYSNGKTVDLVREDSYTKYTGILSGIHWGDNHSFTYTLVINPDNYKWVGATGQFPSKLLFCKEDVFLKIKEERVKIDTSSINATPLIIDTSVYYKNIDNRYFFDLFGDQYFVPTDSNEYAIYRRLGVEEIVPFE